MNLWLWVVRCETRGPISRGKRTMAAYPELLEKYLRSQYEQGNDEPRESAILLTSFPRLPSSLFTFVTSLALR